MDAPARYLEHLIKETGLTKKAFAQKAGLPQTSLHSILQRGVGSASVNNVIKVCQCLGVTVEEVTAVTDDTLPIKIGQRDEKMEIDENTHGEPAPKSLREELHDMVNGLNNDHGFALSDGDYDMSEEEKELLIDTLENTVLLVAKKKSKKKSD
ncbi:helix-turn-helix domain-containing protein [Shouchella lonarensis]|uniref:Cro/C1-type HTH DNA-binding domain-containing protein n=1 Tax=Shouchella lonarensis TaxID=1464122 RepID=A0A1G6HU78_9BACI|nr:helix-turn-helix transcriptional regulator [Shouchella lonarensis]SDB97026.1 Cro/C1-type HTH DNA-binding domain-containing protein [Shouchella lonarensis]